MAVFLQTTKLVYSQCLNDAPYERVIFTMGDNLRKKYVYTNTTKHILIHICIIKELTKNWMHKITIFSQAHRH